LPKGNEAEEARLEAVERLLGIKVEAK